ncbi:MAG: DUF4251 domain-containing protein [Gillisia sp.]
MKRRRIINYFLSLLVLVMVLSCGSATTSSQDAGQVSELLNSRHFEIENNWTLPLSGNRINLIGNPNHIRVMGDSVDVFLPYFGVRHSGGGYNSENGIVYKGIARDFNIVAHDTKNIYDLSFKGSQGGESLNFFITVYSNGNTNTSVNSSQRQSISYTGKIKDLPRKEE